MFKKLRIKFIAITMVMVAVVMALAFIAVCATEYQRSLTLVETAMHESVEQVINVPFDNRMNGRGGFMQDASDSQGSSGWGGVQGNSQGSSGGSKGQLDSSGSFESSTSQETPQGEVPEGFEPPEGFDPGFTEGSTEFDGNFSPPRIGFRKGQQRASNSIVPVAVYRVEQNGSMTVIPEVTSASISDDVLADAQTRAENASDGDGTFQDLGLHYYKVTRDDKVVYLAFADTSNTDQWKSLATTLGVAGLITMLVFFVISLFYSRWALKPVREAWDSQRQFVADASHDLKTPLTVILANASILMRHPDHTIASESQWIESTQVEAENMQGLVNEMLELAQVEAGPQLQQEQEDVDLSDLIDGTTLQFDSVALERNCTFNCVIEPNLHVMGNPQQLKKMVSTLVENAFKYVNANGTIDVTVDKNGKRAVLVVRNTGSGISPEDLPHIFDRFYRTDKARTSGAGGFGLGLAIAREIARVHGGDITCTSSEELGTAFTVTLPCE